MAERTIAFSQQRPVPAPSLRAVVLRDLAAVGGVGGSAELGRIAVLAPLIASGVIPFLRPVHGAWSVPVRDEEAALRLRR